jgi:hypothetical protein
MRGVIARHVTQIAIDTGLGVNRSHSTVRQIEILKLRNAWQTRTNNVVDTRVPFFVKPIGKPVAKVIY